MSSLQSHIVQIPRNAHFRPIPSLFSGTISTPQSSFFTFNANVGATPRLTNPGPGAVGATGHFTNHPDVSTFATTVLPALSNGTGLLKDLGETIVSVGRTFRRVQLITPNVASHGKEMMGGTYTGADSDAVAGYIELGLRGIGIAGPFVRAL